MYESPYNKKGGRPEDRVAYQIMGKGGLQTEGKAPRLAGVGVRGASLGADERLGQAEGVESSVGGKGLPEVRKGASGYRSQTQIAPGGPIREYGAVVAPKLQGHADRKRDGQRLRLDIANRQEASDLGAPVDGGWKLGYGRDAEATAAAYGGSSKRHHGSQEVLEAGAPGYCRAWKESQQAFNFTGTKRSHASSGDFRGAAAHRAQAEEGAYAASTQVAYASTKRPAALSDVKAVPTHGLAARKNQEHHKRWTVGKGAAKSLGRQLALTGGAGLQSSHIGFAGQ